MVCCYHKPVTFILSIIVCCCAQTFSDDVQGQTNFHEMKRWRVHDMKRPQPQSVKPSSFGKAPSDAIVLFNGKDLSNWNDGKGNPAPWKVVDGAIEVVPKKGDIYTKQAFGDCQLHVEWMTPVKIKNRQDAGNSGVMMMGLYEIQIFDSWTTKLYPDGNAGAIYGQHPPQVNASLKPGEWQSFDIIWHGPHFNKDGQLKRSAKITVLHNGVLVQDNVEIFGVCRFMARGTYSEIHEDKLPLCLQEHHRPVRYRNIWLRELPKGSQDAPPSLPQEIIVEAKILDEYVGQYGEGFAPTVKREGSRLSIRVANIPWFDVIAIRKDYFIGTEIDVEFKFGRDDKGKVVGVKWQFCGNQAFSKKTKKIIKVAK
jgi:3-keto-disaccharide hydrolase